jgi:crotonobetainyl-CoA:carnitine CoA-transferase CaiB-like acyl-CoA transferase
MLRPAAPGLPRDVVASRDQEVRVSGPSLSGGLLSPFRALDLADEKAILAGKMLTDLGCDVIKVEPPGGDSARHIPPFARGNDDGESSLFWWAFNTGKRSVTLSIDRPEGKGIFLRLVKTADVVIESFAPGYLDSLGLGYGELEKANPGLVIVSVTPFGLTGPYRDYKTADIVAWAMAGYMYVYGDEDRAPLEISHHSHAFMHAGGEAATAATLALYHREVTGEGQHIDVSIHEATARLDMTHKWDMTRVNLRRGDWLGPTRPRLRYVWPCKDGYVMWQYWVGPAATLWSMPFVRWLDETGYLDDYLRKFPWETVDASTSDGAKAVEEVIQRVQEPTLRFFAARTKAELDAEARKRGLMLYPLSDAKDVMDSVQLGARDFWQTLDHPGIGALRYPGRHAITAPRGLVPGPTRRAPRLGEHNEAVYGELGITVARLAALKKAGIV